MLYSGYTLLLVPFAFAVGALVSGRLGAEWIQVTRRFALAGWLCLGIGLLLGARWSYTELGWGGYWAWDPVENAALMPWLCATAYIHSIMIQEKRGMLKVWNASLVLLTGIAGDRRHVPRPLGDPELDPRVRLRSDAQHLVRAADLGDGDRLGLAWSPGGASSLTANTARLADLARGACSCCRTSCWWRSPRSSSGSRSSRSSPRR